LDWTRRNCAMMKSPVLIVVMGGSSCTNVRIDWVIEASTDSTKMVKKCIFVFW